MCPQGALGHEGTPPPAGSTPSRKERDGVLCTCHQQQTTPSTPRGGSCHLRPRQRCPFCPPHTIQQKSVFRKRESALGEGTWSRVPVPSTTVPPNLPLRNFLWTSCEQQRSLFFLKPLQSLCFYAPPQQTLEISISLSCVMIK